MDFIESLPETNNKNTGIFTVVDQFSKMVHFIPITTTTTAVTAARLFIKHIIRLHGVPTTIVSDRNTRFLSNFWTALMTALGIKLKLSTAYHP